MEHLEEELLNQRIAAADAAVIANNGVQCYIRIFSIIRIRFPKKFTGARILDYETALYHYKKTKQKYAKSDKRSLLNRMDKYSHNHLLFLETLKH